MLTGYIAGLCQLILNQSQPGWGISITLLWFLIFLTVTNTVGFICHISLHTVIKHILSLGLMRHFAVHNNLISRQRLVTIILCYIMILFLAFFNRQINSTSLNFWKCNLSFLVSPPDLRASRVLKSRGVKTVCNSCCRSLFSLLALEAMSFQQLKEINSHLGSVNTCN